MVYNSDGELVSWISRINERSLRTGFGQNKKRGMVKKVFS